MSKIIYVIPNWKCYQCNGYGLYKEQICTCVTEQVGPYKDREIEIISHDKVADLKNKWLVDPCWDLYDSDGYELFYDELSRFQTKMEKQWTQERLRICKNCLFSFNFAPESHLQCRRHAPTPIIDGRTYWPTVDEKDWCGEFEKGTWQR